MISLLLFYIVLPVTLGCLLIRFIQRRAPYVVPPDVAENLARDPLPKKWFRAARRDAGGLVTLGDFETHSEAVDRAYAGKEEAVKARRKAAFLVLNPKGEILEEIDA